MSSIKNLLKAGLVEANSEIMWTRRVMKVSHSAIILLDGTIQTSDGIIHRTPSGAAKHLNGNKPVDGWIAWKMKESKESLNSLRSRLS